MTAHMLFGDQITAARRDVIQAEAELVHRSVASGDPPPRDAKVEATLNVELARSRLALGQLQSMVLADPDWDCRRLLDAALEAAAVARLMCPCADDDPDWERLAGQALDVTVEARLLKGQMLGRPAGADSYVAARDACAAHWTHALRRQRLDLAVAWSLREARVWDAAANDGQWPWVACYRKALGLAVGALELGATRRAMAQAHRAAASYAAKIAWVTHEAGVERLSDWHLAEAARGSGDYGPLDLW